MKITCLAMSVWQRLFPIEVMQQVPRFTPDPFPEIVQALVDGSRIVVIDGVAVDAMDDEVVEASHSTGRCEEVFQPVAITVLNAGCVAFKPLRPVILVVGSQERRGAPEVIQQRRVAGIKLRCHRQYCPASTCPAADGQVALGESRGLREDRDATSAGR
jgi:hypothetical protein